MLLRQSSNYCFIFSKNRKHKIKWEEQEAALVNDTESLGLWRENSHLLHMAASVHPAMALSSVEAEPRAINPFTLTNCTTQTTEQISHLTLFSPIKQL